MAHLKTIQERVEAGQPLSHIHRDLADVLEGIPYYQFTHYVRKYIRHDKRSGLTTPLEDKNHNIAIRREKADEIRFIAPEMAPEMSQYQELRREELS